MFRLAGYSADLRNKLMNSVRYYNDYKIIFFLVYINLHFFIYCIIAPSALCPAHWSNS